MGTAEGTEKGLGPVTYTGHTGLSPKRAAGPDGTAMRGQAGTRPCLHHSQEAQPLYCCW